MRRNDFEFKAEILRRKEKYLKQRKKKSRIFLFGVGSLAVCLLFLFLIPGIVFRERNNAPKNEDLALSSNYVSVNGRVCSSHSQVEMMVLELESLFVREESSSGADSIQPSGGAATSSDDTKQEIETAPSVDSPSAPESTGDSGIDWIEDPGDAPSDSAASNYIVIEVCNDGDTTVYTLFSDRIYSEGKTVSLTEKQAERLWKLFRGEN